MFDLKSRFMQRRAVRRGAGQLRYWCAGLALVLGMPAHAAEYPERPVTLVVPFTAGTADTLARMVAKVLGPELGQPVVVMNKPGAGGALGSVSVARSDPDGYTLLLSATGPHSISPAVNKDLGYSPAQELVPVVQLTSSPFVLVTSETFKGNSVSELIAQLKEDPGAYNFASTGIGTIVHLFGEYFKSQAGVDAVHVPYPGGAPATLALLKDEVLFSITNIPNVQAHINAGKLKGLATTGAERSPAFPDLPTLKEAGLQDFALNGWMGIFAPAKTPMPVLEKLNAAVAKVMQSQEIRDTLLAQGDEVSTPSVEEFADFVAQSDTFWANIAKMANVSVSPAK